MAAQAFSFLLALVLVAQAQEALHETSRIYGPCGDGFPGTTGPCNARQGAINVGAFFPLHEWDYVTKNCSSKVRTASGFERMEAFRWTVNKYMKTMRLDIGYDIRDTCSRDTYARDEALDFINVGRTCLPAFKNRPISLVVGAASSGVSTDLTNLLALFNVPQISYASTSDGLNNSRFSAFFRVVPPDNFQVSAMVSLLQRYSWTYVSVIYTKDEYGETAFNTFNTLTQSDNFTFCIGARRALSLDAAAADYKAALADLKVVDALNWHVNASVVIVFAQARTARLLLVEAAKDADINSRGLTWVASDAWAESLDSVVRPWPTNWGLLSVHPTDGVSADTAEFQRAFGELTRSNYNSHSFYDQYFKALYPGPCNSQCNSRKIKDSLRYSPDPKVPYVIRATYLTLQAIRSVLNTRCSSSTVTNCALAHDEGTGALKSDHTKKAFEAVTHREGAATYLFDAPTHAFLEKSKPIRYAIKNLVNFVNGKPLFEHVGEWDNITGLTISQKLSFNLAGNDKVPVSMCARPCGVGERRRLLQVNFRCCWACERCPNNTFAPNNTVQTCSVCPPTQQSNAENSACAAIKESFLEFDNPLSVLILFFACLGLLTTVWTAVVFINYYNTPLVMASSRELSACLLVGFFIAFTLALAFIAEPSAASCGIRRFGLGFSFSLCFSALLIKTNRISRVFNRQPGSGRPAYITPSWQLIFVGVLVLFQVSDHEACQCNALLPYPISA